MKGMHIFRAGALEGEGIQGDCPLLKSRTRRVKKGLGEAGEKRGRGGEKRGEREGWREGGAGFLSNTPSKLTICLGNSCSTLEYSFTT